MSEYFLHSLEQFLVVLDSAGDGALEGLQLSERLAKVARWKIESQFVDYEFKREQLNSSAV